MTMDSPATPKVSRVSCVFTSSSLDSNILGNHDLQNLENFLISESDLSHHVEVTSFNYVFSDDH